MNKDSLKIIQILKKEYTEKGIRLNHRNPYELVISTILSAQCTDERVNKTTPALFKKYPNALALSKAKINDVETLIKSTGFYHAKAKSIITTSQMIVNNFNSKVPNTMDELLSLRGVARKTANIVLNQAFNKVEGIAVDTHVFRISRRLGFSKANDANKVEQDLMKLLPRNEWGHVNDVLIDHGRAICKAKSPLCDKCIISKYCPSAFKV